MPDRPDPIELARQQLAEQRRTNALLALLVRMRLSDEYLTWARDELVEIMSDDP